VLIERAAEEPIEYLEDLDVAARSAEAVRDVENELSRPATLLVGDQLTHGAAQLVEPFHITDWPGYVGSQAGSRRVQRAALMVRVARCDEGPPANWG
jgi:hypothetical protein